MKDISGPSLLLNAVRLSVGATAKKIWNLRLSQLACIVPNFCVPILVGDPTEALLLAPNCFEGSLFTGSK
jgi:hypothetical protein